ncbi:MAG TPA: tannase/feruloyl esterase family alpha/beta hydrolase [Bryobacteraceae bacterium]|jgi:feruloyl esterase
MLRVALAGLVFLGVSSAPLFAEQTCQGLMNIALEHATITFATAVPEGPVSGGGRGGPPVNAPAHCAVQGIIRPTKDSEIHFELWIPASGWNGKYLQLGNGGWAGAINAAGLAEPVKRGYAAAATDDGHQAEAPIKGASQGGAGATWAIGHPEKLVDFGYRAVHETNLQSKAIIRDLFGRAPSRSYFNGCSDGGREALMEAQRYAEDFDGIIAGAPASDWSHLFTGFIWNARALTETPGSAIPPAKLSVIQKAVLAECDAADGVKDGLLQDPRACRFDPSVLTCKGAEGPQCLTAPQVEALRKIYEGPKNPRTGAPIFLGYARGTEAGPAGWSLWIAPASVTSSIQYGFGSSYYGQAVFEDPKWDYRNLNFDTDVAFGDQKAGPVLNATNPDLRSFRANGGKLIQYHGWGDPAISPLSSIAYYDSVRAFLDKFPDARHQGSSSTQEFYRLFMVPGMGHCGGGVGANSFGNGASAQTDSDHDVISALDRWVETGVAPDKIIAAGTVVGDTSKALTRPLCPYPQVARYDRTGDPNNAASFACVAPQVP